ncbi:hypothetical protein D3C73_1558750 [compost metagenome]
MLHLHGLQDQEPLPSTNPLSFLDLDGDGLAWHRTDSDAVRHALPLGVCHDAPGPERPGLAVEEEDLAALDGRHPSS